ARRALLLAAALAVQREDERLLLAARLEPRARELVAERAIRVGEHRIGGLADERVAEPELRLAREPARGPPDEDLLRHQGFEPRADRAEARAAEQRRHAVG